MEKNRYAIVYLDKIQGVASPNAHAVYLYLSKHSDKDNLCFPTINYISKCIKVSRDTVERALSELEDIGAIRREKRVGESNKYELIR